MKLKMKKKIVSFFMLLMIMFFSCSSVFATTSTIESTKTTFELVDKSICEMDLDGKGHFKKELTSFDSEKRELTITLTVTNTAEKEEITKPAEVFLVLDNSNSMTKTYKGKNKMEYVKETANAFADSLFNHFTDIKIGVVSFSSLDPVASSDVALGTINDASLLLPLSTSKDSVKNSIASYTSKSGPYTNIEAGLQTAQNSFSDNAEAKKYVILISDGVPNLSLDTEHTLTYSGTNATNTRNKLLAMQNAGYHVYSVLMGLNETNSPNPSAPIVPGGTTHMTYGYLAEEIFGTEPNPTAGKFYYINYEDLNTTINNDIYNDITSIKDNSLKDIVIKDYIPQEIMDNFTFEYVISPTKGTVTDTVNPSDNSITWTIPVLNEKEVATVSYKLKLKETVGTDILNKVLPTNTKVDIDFKTPDGEKTISSDVSPKVVIKYEEPAPEPDPEPQPKPQPKPEPKPEPKPDNTIANKPIPQTGIYVSILFGITILGISIFGITRIHILKKLK